MCVVEKTGDRVGFTKLYIISILTHFFDAEKKVTLNG
jgi:hypothetical protein